MFNFNKFNKDVFEVRGIKFPIVFIFFIDEMPIELLFCK